MSSRKRKIPSTMATQHPDHAHTPFWHYTPFISTQEEPDECLISFKDLGVEEYKWDWEGKLVDESVVERLFSTQYEYFSKHPIGLDKFMTFRLPNPKVETEFRLGRAFMGIIAASGLAKHLQLPSNPLFEVILPMTETAGEMIDIQEAFCELASLKHPLLKRASEDINYIELIPLFEDIDTISHSDEILAEYIARHVSIFHHKPEYMRPYVARSDPALNAGIIPTVLAIKIALSRYKDFSERYSIPLYPIIGAAVLPFRGGISPRTVDAFMHQYSGIRTTTIQSAFRYDFPKDEVVEALEKLNNTLKKNEAQSISQEEEIVLHEIMQSCKAYYTHTIEKIAPLINQIAAFVPKRRERVQHVGLFGYSRGVGSVKLPRAITFTAALYSIGVPPEIIGTGRGIKAIKKQNRLDLLESIYTNLRSDLLFACQYVNYEVLKTLAKNVQGFDEVLEDYQEIHKFIHEMQNSQTEDEKEHERMTSQVYQFINEGKDPHILIEKAALLRRSIG